MEKQLVPQLRFPNYFDKWNINNLNFLADVYDGTHQTPKYVNQGVPFVSVENIDDITKTQKFVTKEAFEKNYKIKPRKGDILMTRITAGIIGNTAVVKNNNPLAYYVSLALIRRKNEKLTINYLNHSINSIQFKRELHRRIIHIAFPKKINLGEIGLCKISYPPLPEQHKIASFLTDVDAKITQLTKKKTLLEQYKKGIMQKIFSQELRFKDDNGNAFPKWEEKKLGEVFKISAGGDIDKSNVSKEKTDVFKFPIFANSEKQKGLYGYSDIFKVDYECVTVTGRGSLGIAIARYENFYPIVRLLVLKPKIDLNVFFFENAINTINILSESTGVPQLTSPQLSSYKVKFPCIEEQTKIANFLSDIDVKIEALNTKIENSKAFKKGLLQQLFV